MNAIASMDRCILLHIGSDEVISYDLTALQFLTEVSAKTSCPLHLVTLSWISPKIITDTIAALKKLSSVGRRDILLVSGYYLEDQVTVCVLEALAEGFDVNLLYDFIEARDILIAPILQQRLFQAGAVPSSLNQILYLWHAAELDQNRANSLQDLQKMYKDCNHLTVAARNWV